MERLYKKCLIASLSTHGLLLLVVVFGSAFFVAKKPPVDVPSIRVVPGKLVDELLSGGGGDPQVAPSQDKIKGETLLAQPPAAQAPPPKPAPTPPKPEPRPAEPRKLALVPTTRNTPKKQNDNLPRLKLTPVNAQAARADNKAAKARAEIAEKLGDTVSSLRSGFEQGTAVQVHGPGGEAYVNYAQWVKQVYQDAWVVSDDLDDEQATAKVSVTIARNGDVISAQLTRRSGNAVLDGSVERTLKIVRFIRPFPEGAKDNQRTFIINFNLKAKRAIG